MPDISTFAAIAVASLALALIPGPAVFYIVARSMEGGRQAGLVSAFGIAVGGLIQVLLAAVGLSAVLASSATAFSFVKWLGVAYLLWLGFSRLFGNEEQHASAVTERRSLSGMFRRGVLVNVLNPKVALFFLAFLPQFVDSALGSAWLQILLLGLTFVAIAMVTDSLYALLSGDAANWLRRKNESSCLRRSQRYISGVIYLALGVVTAMSGSGKD